VTNIYDICLWFTGHKIRNVDAYCVVYARGLCILYSHYKQINTMIKVIRQTHQRLLIKNKFKKYLLYAMGEIVLVAIGVLIALQVNNLNTIHSEKQNLE
jgi:hypothetical protein